MPARRRLIKGCNKNIKEMDTYDTRINSEGTKEIILIHPRFPSIVSKIEKSSAIQAKLSINRL